MPEQTGPRILADDLTGALDSGAAFAAARDPIEIRWRLTGALPAAGAFDAGTRERQVAEAAARHRALADWLADGEPAFKKIDSLMRGHWAAELAALAERRPEWRMVIAPAFPFQGRVTRGGRQWRTDSSEPLGSDIAGALASAGIDPARIVVRDAQTDADLDAVVAGERMRGGPLLWVGTGGLAAALARARPGVGAVLPDLAFRGPLLALIGSHHPVTIEQVARAEAADPGCHLRLGSDTVSATVLSRLEQGRPTLATVAFDGDRASAERVIAERFARLLEASPRPGCLFVTGGETLRGVAEAVGAEALMVEGAIEPGLPLSRLRGGRFDGLAVISKSGAFGGPELLRRLVAKIDHAR